MLDGHQVALRAWKNDSGKEICVCYARKSRGWENENNEKDVCWRVTFESGWEGFFSLYCSVMRRGCIFIYHAFHCCGFLYSCIFYLVSDLITFGAALLTTKASMTHEVLDLPFAYQVRTTTATTTKKTPLIICRPAHLIKDKWQWGGPAERKGRGRYGCIPQLACKTNYLNSPTHSLSRSPSVSNGFLYKCVSVWEAKECAGVENVRTR